MLLQTLPSFYVFPLARWNLRLNRREGMLWLVGAEQMRCRNTDWDICPIEEQVI